MQVGDLVTLKGWPHYAGFGVIVSPPEVRIMLSGASLQEHVAVAWVNGAIEWYSTADLKQIS